MHHNHNYHQMEPEHLIYWLERAKAEVNDRDALIQNQRNEIERLTKALQEVNYNACMQNSIIAYEVQRFAHQHLLTVPMQNPAICGSSSSSASSSYGGAVPVVRLCDLEAFLSQMTGGILQQHYFENNSSSNNNATSSAATSSSCDAGPSSGAAAASSSAAPSPQKQQSNGNATSNNNTDYASSYAHPAFVSPYLAAHATTRLTGKRCRDDANSLNDGRPIKPGQWFFSGGGGDGFGNNGNQPDPQNVP